MTTFTQKHYEALANRFGSLLSEFRYDVMLKSPDSEITLKYVISRIGDLLKEDNAAFREDIFLKWIENKAEGKANHSYNGRVHKKQ